ncbi:MAG TPA: hypothetical protein VFT32_01855 [Candidatus Eisenbacteria bacterium]|nr:hypothetical protein [Candidatus Eisenbacteria bacterium]
MRRLGVALLLIASLALNVWLGWRATRTEPRTPTPPPTSEGGAGAHDLLDSVERDWLQRAGFPSPADSLRADLLRHPELIPAEGVVGGTMAFREGSIWILPAGHVWAVADDGHIEVSLLLRYDVGKERRIAWRVVYIGGS